jgi:RNA polymerase sigma-70 factor (ECF subfamily)
MPLDPEALDQALRRAREGDPDAYGTVVSASQARLRAFIAGYVPDAQWVDDIAQQAFVSAYRDLRDFQPGTDFYAWLRQIAYNHLRAELERASRRRRLERDHLAEITAGELSRRLERERDEESLEALRECVRRLSGTGRQIIRSYYGESLPLGRIARDLGRTADSLKVSLFKIRARLKSCIEGKQAAADAEPL